MPNCNSQVIILFHFILYPPLDCSQGPKYNSQVYICFYLLVCAYMLVCLRVYSFSEGICIQISCFCDLGVYLLLLYFYMIHLVINKCMTSPHQSNANCDPIFSISRQSNTSENLNEWVSPTLDPQGPSTCQIMFV